MSKIVKILSLLVMALPCLQASASGLTDSQERVSELASVSAGLKASASEPADSLMRETFAIKTNLLYDAGGVPSLGVEFPVSRSGRWSLDVSATYNPIRMSGSNFWKNWMLQPEIRYNFGRQLGRPRGITYFWGTHLIGGQYNLQRTPWLRNIWNELNDWRFEGWGIGAGTGIGVRINFSRHFGMEIEAAAGYIYSRYNRYRCGNCGERAGHGTKHYVGPTKAAVNFLFRLFAPAKKKVQVIDAWPETRDTVIIERAVTDTVTLIDTVPGDTVVIPPAIRRDRIAMRLDFAVNDSNIDPARGDNTACLDSLRAFIDRYRDDLTLRIQSIDVEGFSSIDGGAVYNQRLSERRAASLASYIQKEFPKLASLVESTGRGEDWDSLDLPDIDRLMEISDLDARQRELMKIEGGSVYRELMRQAIPSTRRVEVSIDYTVVE